MTAPSAANGTPTCSSCSSGCGWRLVTRSLAPHQLRSPLSVTKCERSKGRPPSCTLSFSSFSPTFSLDSLLLLLPPRGIPAALLASSTTSSFPSHTQRLSHAVAPQAFRSRYGVILHAGVVMVFTTCQIANLKAAARKLPEGSRPVTPLSFLCGSPLTHAFSEIDQAPLSKGLLNTSPSVWPPIFSFFFRALLAGHMQACKRLRIVYTINFSGDAWDMGTAWAALCK